MTPSGIDLSLSKILGSNLQAATGRLLLIALVASAIVAGIIHLMTALIAS